MFDPETLFHRMRKWVPSGIGAMTGSDILHQMGGRQGVDPYGWSERRIRAAWTQLIDEESIDDGDGRGAYYVTAKGIEKYEGELK